MSRPAHRLALLPLAGLVAALTLDALGAAPAHAEEPAPKILLILDASGSMNGKDPSGTTKIEAARKALTSTVNALPAHAEVGLRVFGATQPGGEPTPAACADTQLVHPVGPLDKSALTAAVDSLAARGETPIAYSLAEGVKDLGADGQRHIILVSDGEESCVPDPCPQVRELAGQGVTLQIDTVGFGVNAQARTQLQCIADAGNGTYYEAKDADALESSLNRLSTRAVRPFTVQGTPVTGTPEPEGAPVLTLGQYTDRIVSSTQGDVERHFMLRRTMPGSTLRAGIVGRMPYASGIDGVTRGGWRFELTTADGATKCDSTWDMGSDTTGVGTLVSGATVALPLDPRTASPTDKAVACAEAAELLLTVTTTPGNSAFDVPIELRVIEEPPVTNDSELPSGVAEVPKGNSEETSPASGTPQRVVAGTSFNDALELAPGTYEVEVVPGETVYVKTPLQWGQSAVFAIDGPDPQAPALQSMTMYDYLGVAGDVYAPDTSQIDSQELWRHANYNGRDVTLVGQPDINVVPEVRYRNRWDSPAMYFSRSRGFAMAGDYYFSIGVNQAVESLTGTPIPVRFSFAVNGTPNGAVETLATPTPAPTEPAAAPAPSGSSGTPIVPIVGGLLVIGGVLGGAGYLVWRRRS